MIIKKITLNNFFRYYGKQEIVFSNNCEKNVTIIRGENGSGKTTLLNAFYWVFYGKLDEPLTEDKMLNYMATAKMKNGESEIVTVEIEFDEKGIKYTITRKQRYIKKDNNINKLGETQLSVTYTNEKGNETNVDYPEIFFENIIPEKLRKFFFFDGERINRLAQEDGKDEIRKAILDILGLTTLKQINDDLDKVNEELVKEMKKYLRVDEEILSIDYTCKLEDKRRLEESLISKKEELSKALQNLNEIDQFLRDHNSEIVRKKQNDRLILEQDIQRLNARLDENRKNILTHISRNFKTYLITSQFSQVSALLEEKRIKGELPSDIKIQFIDDLLERKRCICGRPLIEGTEEYNIVQELKKIAGRTELDDAYTKITSFIKYADQNKNYFYETYHKYAKEENDIRDDIDLKEKKLKNINDELKNSSIEKIREYEILREKVQADITNINREIGKNELKLNEVINEIAKMQKKISDAKLISIQAQEIQKQIVEVQKLGQLNNEIQSFFIKSTRENLDAKIKQVFALMTHKEYRVPVLTDNFQLKIISILKNNTDSEVLSTGEGQITSLAFIGSLVSYSKEKANSGMLSDFMGGDFPIVMDSPFGNLDEVHTANVATNIGKLASQVIIIVSDKQWNKEVEENITNQVGKMYKMVDGNFGEENTGEYTILKEVAI